MQKRHMTIDVASLPFRHLEATFSPTRLWQFLLLAFAFLLPASASAVLHTDGKQIKDDAGNVVFLRGTNAGGWLVQESWMNNTTAAYDKQTWDILTSRFGVSGCKELLKTYQDNYWTTQDFDNVAGMGANLLRLPFTYMNLLGEHRNKSLAELNSSLLDFSRLDWFVAQAGQRGIYVILDLHGAFGSQNGMDHSGELNDGWQLYNSSENKAKTIWLWQQFANRYKGNTTVAGYDILNEPGVKAASTYSVQWDFYNDIYHAIRAIDASHIIIMESCWGVNDLPSPQTYGWTNVVYEYHTYLPSGENPANKSDADLINYYTNQFSPIINSSHNVPAYIGEFTGYDNVALWKFQLETLNSSGLHYSTWNYKAKHSSSWGIYNHNANEANITSDSFETIKQKWSSRTADGWVHQKIYDVLKNGFNGSSGAQARFFQHENYNGWEVQLGIGNYDYNEMVYARGIPNDALSAIKVPQGLKVTLYEHAGFGGSSVTLSSGEYPNLDSVNFNNRASSIKIAYDSSSSGNTSGGEYFLVALANLKVVCAENNGASTLVATRDTCGGAWETFTIVNNGDGSISFRSHANGKYVTAILDEQNQLLSRASSIGDWERFKLEHITGEDYAIKSLANNKYVKADLDNGGKLFAIADSVAGAWEAFYVKPVGTPYDSSGTPWRPQLLPNGDYYLTAIANKRVVCAENNGASTLAASRDDCNGKWETFELINNDDGSISLRSRTNSNFVMADVHGGGNLIPVAINIGEWERFFLEKQADGTYALLANANNKYVQANLNAKEKLYAVAEAVYGEWEAFAITPVGQDDGLEPVGVTVYSNANYSGNQASLGLGEYNMWDLAAAGISNDTISSLRVPKGYRVTLYNNIDFRGRIAVFFEDTSDVGSFDNMTTSLRVERDNGQVLSEGNYYLRSRRNFKLVCAEIGGSNQLIANRDAVRNGETFVLTNNSDGTIAFLAKSNNKYVYADLNTDNRLIPNGSGIGGWERLYIERVTAGEFAFKSKANNKYVQANIDKGGRVGAYADKIGGAWEVFEIGVP